MSRLKNKRGSLLDPLMTIAAFNKPPQPEGGTNEQRRQRGRTHTSSVLVYWLSRNGWSHPNMELLAKWALNEDSALHPSQMSLLRNAKTKLMGVKALDSLGQINLAVWAWQQQQKQLLKTLGVGVMSDHVEQLIEHAEVLMNPHTGLPIDQADWMSIYLGYLQIPQVVNGPEGDPQFQEIASAFGQYVEQVRAAKGIPPIEMTQMLTKATGNAELAETLVLAAVGLKVMEPNMLTTQFEAICKALTVLDGKERTPMGVVSEIREMINQAAAVAAVT